MKLDKHTTKLHLKCAEELSELAVRLLQQVNKPKKDYSKKICEEIVHVQEQLEYLMPLYYDVALTTYRAKRIAALKEEDKDRPKFYKALLANLK